MKKAIAILLALVIVMSLAACGGGSATTNTPAPTEAPATPEPTEAPAPPATETPTTPEPITTPEPTEEPEPEPQEDLISVESISLTPLPSQTGAMVKIRNISDELQDFVDFPIKALDKNGDVLTTLYVCVEYLEAGTAETTGHWRLDCQYEDIDSLKISSYNISKSRGDGSFGKDNKEYRLNDPITFTMYEATTPDEPSRTGKSYLWLPTSVVAEAGKAIESIYGRWEVAEIKNNAETLAVSTMEENNVYSWSDWVFIVSETGEMYLQTNNTSTKGKCTVDSEGVTAGNNRWDYNDNKLILTSGNTTIYYEKVSDSQEFPSLEKADFVDMLVGTWELRSPSKTGVFSFTSKTATATINDVVFDAETICIQMDENRIIISSSASGVQVSMDLTYKYDNNTLAVQYGNDYLIKQ